uniref:NADH-ubiquinone oxidoreductase chain 3 n=1 Tax=Gesiella jameensis TaxID=1960709 RepID=A0A8E7IW02_9ANNE|nr:NADH dehydrogenase subunit 3 [Gesiella jameensis]
MIYMFMMFMLTFMFPMLILSTSMLITMRSIKNREKQSPFECGFDPNKNARIPFSLRFFLLVVIFLVFDVEIVLLLPSPFLYMYFMSMKTLNTIIMFILILIMGLIHEWNEGSLEWTN